MMPVLLYSWWCGLWRAGCLAGLIGVLFLPFDPASAQEDAGEALSDQPSPPVSDADLPPSLLPVNDNFTGDLDGLRKRKSIRILVPYSKTFYFVIKGKQAGATYDTGKAFETWLNKQDKTKDRGISVIFVPTSRDKLISGLVAGDGDIAAGNITITENRSKQVDFGNPFLTGVREILVTGPSAPPIASLADLVGKEILVRPSSSYFEHLTALNAEWVAAGKTPIMLTALDEDLEDEDVLEMVNSGLLPWAVLDEHKAKLWSAIYTKLTLHPDVVIHEGGEIAWAIRKDSPLLKDVVDRFADAHKIGTTFGNTQMKRYMGSKSPIKQANSPEEMKKMQHLVGLFKEYGKQYKFDYLMIAAQGYQESKLDQKARSHRGAVGVMQLMPSTAADKAIGIQGIDKDVAKNVEAGVKYMRLLTDKYLNDPGLDDKNRTLMAFAAYNAGPGNLRKFRKLAEKSGLDPNIWFGNVEHAAADIVGRETVDYVSNIYIYYVAYSLAAKQIDERTKEKESLQTTP
jgi:membrane-bound lytic murein transglycosylase MltF